jgi:hypothetical protein
VNGRDASNLTTDNTKLFCLERRRLILRPRKRYYSLPSNRIQARNNRSPSFCISSTLYAYISLARAASISATTAEIRVLTSLRSAILIPRFGEPPWKFGMPGGIEWMLLAGWDQRGADALKLGKARKQAAKAITNAADCHAAKVLPIIREAGRAGATSLRAIADALNARAWPPWGERAVAGRDREQRAGEGIAPSHLLGGATTPQ